MMILKRLLCTLFGHKSAIQKERGIQAFEIRGMSGVILGEMHLCSRCHSVYWEVDPLVIAAGVDINTFDDRAMKAVNMIQDSGAMRPWAKA
jgi:hypothetical protein